MVSITNDLHDNLFRQFDSQLYDRFRYPINDQLWDKLYDNLNKDLKVIIDKIYSRILRKITWEILNFKNNG